MIEKLSRLMLMACVIHASNVWAEDSEPAESKPAKTRAAKSRGKTDATKADTTSGSLDEESEAPAPAVRISRSRHKPHATPAEAGWAALAAGDLNKARTDFERAIKQDPRATEALVGLAHLAAHQKQTALAGTYVQRALEAQPRHPEAQALAIMLTTAGDPIGQESAARNLIAADAANASAHFALGRVLANRGRWQEAQDAFFRAWSLEPDQADYQYNLAVSLDHLNQPLLALDHYRGALAASARRAAAFDQAAAKARITQLDVSSAPKPKEATQ